MRQGGRIGRMALGLVAGLAGWAGAGAGAALAETPATIIVLDGSGSMWGQIDGRPKLEIARETVGKVLDQIPPDQTLGLMAYGHREKGNCGDIELIVPPAPGSSGQIRDAVAAMRFLGKTPLSDAVRQAAEALRYGEDAARVVLVTDGLETCAADPCALGRELEAAGLDFTAHVIGFGLTQAEGAQVSCLADATGGRYFAADDADALAAALAESVAEPAAVPEPPRPRSYFPGAPRMENVALQPTGQTTGQPEGSPPEVAFPADGTSAQCQALCENEPICAAWRYEPPGSYFVAEARCVTYGASSEMDYQLFPPDEGWASGIKDGVLMLVRPYVAPETLPEAALQAPAQAQAGETIAVGWTGPAADLDVIEIGLPGDGERWAYGYVAAGNPLSLVMPGEPGSYELRYKFRDQWVIATAPIEVTAASVVMDAPDQVAAGAEFQLHWTGPNADYDNIQIGPAGSDDYISYAYVSAGNPLVLTAPDQPGAYELRYKLSDAEVIATRPLLVVAADALAPAPLPVVIEAADGGLGLAVSWSAVPVEGQDLPPEAWAMPESVAGPVEAAFLPGLYDVTGAAGDQVFAGRIEVVAGGETHFTIPLSPDLSPAGEDQDQGAADPAAPMPLRIKGVYDGAFTSWEAFALGGQETLPLASGAPAPGAWQTALDPGPWLIRGLHDGAAGATYLAVLEVAPGLAPEVTIPRPRYGAEPGDGAPLQRLCPEGGPICLITDEAAGLRVGLPPGWGMEEAFVMETAAGVTGQVFAAFQPLGPGGAARQVALNPRQWDAMLGPCEAVVPGLLCRGADLSGADLQAYQILRVTLDRVAAADPPPADIPSAGGGDPAGVAQEIPLTLPEGFDPLELLAPQLAAPEGER